MGKLKFKGDKKPKKKKAPEPERSPDSTQTSFEGWSSAQTVSDLKGPALILHATTPPTSLSYDSVLTQFLPSSKLDVVPRELCVNFFESTEYDVVHQLEPTSTSQLFKFVPIDTATQKSLLSKSEVTSFALRFKDYYLCRQGSDLGVSYAISENEIFSFQPEKRLPAGDVLWCITVGDKQLALKDDKYCFVTGFDPAYNFIIRVYTTNTVEGAKRKLAAESNPEDSSDIKKAIRQLYKDTNGKITISKELVSRLKNSQIEGRLHDQIIDEKAKILTRW